MTRKPPPASPRPDRRRVVAGGLYLAAAVALPPRAASAQGSAREPRRLSLRPGVARLRGPETAPTDIWGFDGTVPGPVLRVTRGGELFVRAVNELPQPTTVHWHGLRLDNRMDGVPHLTQEAIAPGASFDYRFVCPDAGTFWYHPHAHSSEQLERGLAGVLIVDEDQPVDVDRDVALVFDDWRLSADGAIDTRFDLPFDAAHAGRLGRHLTLNGSPRFELPARQNERLRLRLVNVANARVATIGFDGLKAHVVAVDGQPSEVIELGRPQATMPPGGRVDLIADITQAPGAEIPLVMRGYGEEAVVGRIVVIEGAPARPAPRDRVAPLPDNPLPKRIDLKSALRVDLVMEGGAMGGMGMRGGPMGPGQPGRNGAPQIWFFNGRSGGGHDGPPLFSTRRGRAVVLAVNNQTRWPHAIHLHGHHARLLDDLDDGWKPWWIDTLLIGEMRTSRIAFVADNPGKWMIHCHMLEHQATGMGTWFEVT